MVNKNQFVLKSKFYIVPFINIRFRKNVISIVGDFNFSACESRMVCQVVIEFKNNFSVLNIGHPT